MKIQNRENGSTSHNYLPASTFSLGGCVVLHVFYIKFKKVIYNLFIAKNYAPHHRPCGKGLMGREQPTPGIWYVGCHINDLWSGWIGHREAPHNKTPTVPIGNRWSGRGPTRPNPPLHGQVRPARGLHGPHEQVRTPRWLLYLLECTPKQREVCFY